MGRARSAIAARTTIEALAEALLSALSLEKKATANHDDFYDVVSFCRSNSEDYEGEDGSEAWYLWKVGDWAVAGDLSLKFTRCQTELEALCTGIGETILGAVDSSYEYAFFSSLSDGETRRLLILEDDEITDEGFPVAAERGRQSSDFDEEEAERLWTSYGLPTFEYDPIEGPFLCVSVTQSA